MRLIKQSPDRKGGVSAPDKPKNAKKNLEKGDYKSQGSDYN